MKILLPLSILLFSGALTAQSGTFDNRPVTIGYVRLPGGLSPEDSSAIAWLQATPRVLTRVIDITNARLDTSEVDLLWLHITDSAAYARWHPYLNRLRALGNYYRRGGKILFTDCAGMLPSVIGIESEPSEMRSESIADDWLFDQKGIQGFRGHPVFEGLFGGVFLWDTNVDNVVFRTGYFGNRFPQQGKVVGIEKSYVILNSDSRLMIEYASGKGRAMTIGGFVYFSRPNAKRLYLEYFMSNVVRYLVSGKSTIRPTYWEHTAGVPTRFAAKTSGVQASRPEKFTNLPTTGLILSRVSPRNDFYDVAGRRTLVMGRENGGIDEVWVHPFRVLREYQAGLVVGDSIKWLKDLPVKIDALPESFTRTYTTEFGELSEIVFASLRKAGAIVHYHMKNPQAHASLIVAFQCDLRWMWPYDDKALGDVWYGYDDSLHALHVRDKSGDFYCLVGGDRRPGRTLTGRFSAISFRGGDLVGELSDMNQVCHASVFPIGPPENGSLTVAIVGTDGGKREALSEYRSLLSHPRREYEDLVHHYNDLLDTKVTVESPDTEFNSLWKWALVGVDRFVTTTPRLGTALVAGFSTVNRGWDGGHTISGRPGYAWYFGRDSEWSGFAVDDYGDFATVRAQLVFLQRYQGLTGKIFHEISTSGVVHYDAADATPLYIILAAHYLRASGDTAFLRTSWPHIRKAMDFLYSTDTDGDHLIENTNVGHGWVEGGKLWPVHTEFYLAGIWGQALADAAWMATILGKKDAAVKYSGDAMRVKQEVNDKFWNPGTGFYNYGKLKDGSYNPEPTILPAAIMYFGWLDDAKVLPGLTSYSGEGFSSDWGTRIVSNRSRLYSPQGYHEGSVWPLFTGWTALAEYEYGRSVEGFSHILNTLYIKDSWELGFVEEVLRGDVYKPGGVCPHQCWSETNILHPGIHGMIGWRPRALDAASSLNPRFPINWDTVSVRNLHVGTSVIDLSLRRARRETIYRLHLRKGQAVTIDLAPEFPSGTELISASVNKTRVQVSPETHRGVLVHPIRLTLRDSVEVRFTHTGGIGVVPVVLRPAPGDSAHGLRITGAALRGLEYSIDLEGKSGTTALLEVVVQDQNVFAVDGGLILGEHANGRLQIAVRFDPSDLRYNRKQLVLHLEDAAR